MPEQFDFRDCNKDSLKQGFYSYGQGYVHYDGSAPTNKAGMFAVKVNYRDSHGELPCFLTERATTDLKPISDISNLVAHLKKDDVLFFKKHAQSSPKGKPRESGIVTAGRIARALAARYR